MKAAVFYGPGDVRIEEVPEPTAAAGEVKIRVRACSTCGTDLKIFRSGHFHIVPPRVMGHEIAGEIVEVGAGVEGWAPGDRVQVIAAIPDGTCEECRRGHQTVCLNQESMGYQYEGGFAEYMVVPPSVLAVDGMNRIPDGVGDDEASVTEPLACVLNGQELAGVGAGRRGGGLRRRPDRLPARPAGPLARRGAHLHDRGQPRAGSSWPPTWSSPTRPCVPRTATSSSRSASSPTAAARTW